MIFFCFVTENSKRKSIPYTRCSVFVTDFLKTFLFLVWLDRLASLLNTAPHGFSWYCYL